MKKIVVILVCFFTSFCYTQYDIIHTFTSEDLHELSVNDEETIIVGNHNYIAKFVNDEILLLDNSFFPSENVISSFSRVNENTAFIKSVFPWFSGGTFEIYKTNDNCQTWGKIYDTLRLYPGKLIMFDSLEGIHSNGISQMFRTTDGGNQWDLEVCPVQMIDAYDKFNDSVFCVGALSKFRISYNRGVTWSYSSFIMSDPSSFDIISLDTIVACAGGYYARSINGGISWQKKNFIGSYISKIKHQPENNNTLFIVGGIVFYDSLWNEHRQGVIYKSNDFGETWHTYNTGLPTRFLNMEFLNDSVALISGTDGYLIKYFYRDHHLGFEELNDQLSDIKLYPNPASQLQQIEIKTINSENIEVSLLDVFGKEIKTVNELDFHNEVYTASFDLSMLSSGFYVYRVKLGKEIKHFKVSKL